MVWSRFFRGPMGIKAGKYNCMKRYGVWSSSMWLCDVFFSCILFMSTGEDFSLDIVRDWSRVAAEYSTHLHLIPNGRAYHGISSRISFCSIRFVITVF